jgi:hypothetical protein
MQAFRVSKTKPKPPKSSIPPKPQRVRFNEIADSIASDPNNEAMVACTECVNNNVACYYDRDQSIFCAECLRHRRKCDGTFAMEEFRKVGEQKRLLEAESLEKGRKLQELRRKLMDARRALMDVESCFVLAEEEDLKVRSELSAVKDRSSKMLHREMQALGVFEELPPDKEIVLAEPVLARVGASPGDSFDWSEVLNFESNGQQVVGG